jgi:hypothetical protein
MSKYKLSGWSFEPELFEFILQNIPQGSSILELGSGEGTGALSQHYKMYSIEHDKKYVGKYDSMYIHAPMKGHWYEIDVVREFVKDIEYKLILIDGPIGSQSRNRIGFFENIHLFNTNCMLIFDDTNRVGEFTLFENCLNFFTKNGQERQFSQHKTFSVIYP